MDINQLTTEHGIGGQLHFLHGEGGMPFIQVDNSYASALLSVYAGQVLAFRPHHTAHDLLFVSQKAYYQPGKAIKGGIPVCWPWFGADPEGLGRPAHGFVRNRWWEVMSTSTTVTGETQITLGMVDTPETRAIWPHAFRLALEITVGQALHVTLTTRNTGDRVFTLTQALHTYLAVGDITQVQVEGLEGTPYLDKSATGGGVLLQQQGPVIIQDEVDRIYTRAPAILRLDDPALQRSITLASRNSHTAVVWNPGPRITASMADLEDDDYQRFLCVETANAADETIRVTPGMEVHLEVSYTVAEL